MAKSRTVNQVVLPTKLGSKAKTAPPWRTTGKGQAITSDQTPLYQDIRDKRAGFADKITAIRQLADDEGPLSTALYSYVQVANTDFMVTAYDPVTHEYHHDGTLLAKTLLASLSTLYDYTEGFSDKPSIAELNRTMLSEAAITGAVAAELVLNKGLLPDRLNVVPFESLQAVDNGAGGRYYQQKSSTGDYIPLDISTFWVAEVGRHASRAYPTPMFSGAIKDVTNFVEFTQDTVRSVRRSGHNRIKAKLMTQALLDIAPPDALKDADKMRQFLDGHRQAIEDMLSGLNPEDALVYFDLLELETLGVAGEKQDYSPLMDTLAGLAATSLKAYPSIMGMRIGGSQSLSNTESLVFLRNAKALHGPVETVMSRALTLGCRLYGLDVYIKYEFGPINLRPESELEAFKVMRQDRILQMLSLGFMTDDEASHLLGAGTRAPGAPALSGTMFAQKQAATATDTSTLKTDPMGRTLQPGTPTKAGGKSQ